MKKNIAIAFLLLVTLGALGFASALVAMPETFGLAKGAELEEMELEKKSFENRTYNLEQEVEVLEREIQRLELEANTNRINKEVDEDVLGIRMPSMVDWGEFEMNYTSIETDGNYCEEYRGTYTGRDQIKLDYSPEGELCGRGAYIADNDGFFKEDGEYFLTLLYGKEPLSIPEGYIVGEYQNGSVLILRGIATDTRTMLPGDRYPFIAIINTPDGQYGGVTAYIDESDSDSRISLEEFEKFIEKIIIL